MAMVPYDVRTLGESFAVLVSEGKLRLAAESARREGEWRVEGTECRVWSGRMRQRRQFGILRIVDIELPLVGLTLKIDGSKLRIVGSTIRTA